MTLPDLDELAREDEQLRWVASDVAAVEEAAERAAEALRSATGAEELRLLGYLGSARRLLARHEEAIAAHRRACGLAAANGDARAHAVALTRLGESYRCADRLDEAEEALREALAIAPPAVSHFAFQHLGKTLLDRGAHGEAALALEEALRLRRTGGDGGLVASTERALAAARRGAE